MVVDGAWRPADPAAAYFPVPFRPIVVNALYAEDFMVLDQPRDHFVLDGVAGRCVRMVSVAPIAVIVSCAESVGGPGGAATDRTPAITAKIPQTPAVFEVLADLYEIR